MRNYDVMREIIIDIANSESPIKYGAFRDIEDEPAIKEELHRLKDEGLYKGEIRFLDGNGTCQGGEIEGLTKEGMEFYRLIENYDVWEIMRKTLDEAQVDISYPLLKEVCQEIVKRYVASFIPDIKRKTSE
jgi:hypothetical protein